MIFEIPIALAYVWLSTALPRSGGDYVFTSRFIPKAGPFLGWLEGFTLCFASLAVIAFEIDAKTRFQLGVDNLFDTRAPYIASFTDGNTDTMTYDLLGRRFYVGFRTAF
ncbi:MAG: amino acid permease [Proteobacteria bacterium]|nr:amino acid permease [Pseudomonadota bacterium]